MQGDKIMYSLMTALPFLFLQIGTVSSFPFQFWLWDTTTSTPDIYRTGRQVSGCPYTADPYDFSIFREVVNGQIVVNECEQGSIFIQEKCICQSPEVDREPEIFNDGEAPSGDGDCNPPQVFDEDTTSCVTPVDGNWATWTSWGVCSVTCDGGTRTRSRTCTNPAPQHGGEGCYAGNNIYITISQDQIETCNENPCPVDGNWATWGSWDTCSVTCGGGSHSRSRTCTDPAPEHGGDTCDGDDTEFDICNDDPCPVDGNWATWESWDTCSVTCGGGSQSRSRTCTDPAPEHGGDTCDGDASESDSCNEDPCPIDGNWATWMSWGVCSVTCDGGTRTRSRTCTDPAPEHGGAACDGDATGTGTCNENPCPVDGEWSEWGSWSSCATPCATSLRTRSCTNPAPAHGGADCDGIATETQPCGTLESNETCEFQAVVGDDSIFCRINKQLTCPLGTVFHLSACGCEHAEPEPKEGCTFSTDPDCVLGRVESDPTKFCQHAPYGWTEHSCSTGLVFSLEHCVCDYP